MKKIALLTILYITSLDISAAGAKIINDTNNWVGVAVKFDNNTEQAFLLPPGTYNKADGIAAGVRTIVYLLRGVVREIGIGTPGVEGIRDYTITSDGRMSINDLPWPQKQFTNPLGINSEKRDQCDTCAACDSCCKPCTYSVTGSR